MQMIHKENVEMTDPNLPIKTYIVDSSSRELAARAHLHNEIELIYIMEGSMTFKVGDTQKEVCGGEIIFINCLTVHSSEVTPGVYTKICLLQFDPGLIYSSSMSEYKYLSPFIHHDSFSFHIFDANQDRKYDVLTELLTETAHEFMDKQPAYELIIKSDLYRVLSFLYRENVLKSSLDKNILKEKTPFSKLESIIKYVEDNYFEEISLETACCMLNMNYHYFCRQFKKATGKPFVQYLNYVRVSVAEKLLLYTGKPVVDIIGETGFSSLSYFNRTFKKIKGCSPTEYRKRIQG